MFGHSDSVILITLLCWIGITINVVWLFVTTAISLQVTADRRYRVVRFLCLWFYAGQPLCVCSTTPVPSPREAVDEWGGEKQWLSAFLWKPLAQEMRKLEP